MRARGPIAKPGHSFGVKAPDPPVRALPGDTEFFGDMRHRSMIATHALHEQLSGMESQPGISVRHGDLLDVKTRHLHCARRSSLDQLPDRRVTNVLAEYI